MAQIIKFSLSKDDCYKIGCKAFEDGDVEKAISNLKKALDMDGRFAEASIALAQVYASIGAWEISNLTLFEALSKHPTIENKDLIFYQLANNFLELHRFDVAQYYLRDIAEKFDLQLPENFGEESFGEKTSHIRIVSPRGEDYYEMLIERAYELIRQRKFDDAITLVSGVADNSKSKKVANHIVLVCLMMKNDLDSAIVNAKMMLEKDPDNLELKCTLATAFLMEEKNAESYIILDDILKKDYTNMEEVLLVLPLVVNLEVHAEVVKYTKRVLEKLDMQPNTMIWLSQGLYNLGQKTEAKRVMRKVETIYGPYSSASFYLNLYEQNPQSVSYSMNVPYIEKIRYRKAVTEFLSLPIEQITDILKHDECVDANEDITEKEHSQASANDVTKMLDWVFYNDTDELKCTILETIIDAKSDFVTDFARKQLIVNDLSFMLMTHLIACLLRDGKRNLEFDVVAQDRFKSIRVVFPKACTMISPKLAHAYIMCLDDIVFTDEEPNEYLLRLTSILDRLVDVDENGNIYFVRKSCEKINRIKSLKTLVGVLLAKVYEYDYEDPCQATIERYNLNKHTFDRYYKILFGDDDDE